MCGECLLFMDTVLDHLPGPTHYLDAHHGLHDFELVSSLMILSFYFMSSWVIALRIPRILFSQKCSN